MLAGMKLEARATEQPKAEHAKKGAPVNNI